MLPDYAAMDSNAGPKSSVKNWQFNVCTPAVEQVITKKFGERLAVNRI
jgi:hypothetical protein